MIWNNINETRPNDGERCLVWYKGDHEILTYDDYYQCWDTSDGDDFECPLDECIFWLPLPKFGNEN